MTEWNPLRANMAAMGLVPSCEAIVSPDAPEDLKQNLRDDPTARLVESWAVPVGSVAIRRLCPGTGEPANICSCAYC